MLIEIVTNCLTERWITFEWRYNRNINQILICETAEDKKKTLVHEIWHYVWYKKFTEEDRNNFEEKRNKINWIWWNLYDNYINWEFIWSVEEDFAILFASALYDKDYKEFRQLKKWIIRTTRQKLK